MTLIPVGCIQDVLETQGAYLLSSSFLRKKKKKRGCEGVINDDRILGWMMRLIVLPSAGSDLR